MGKADKTRAMPGALVKRAVGLAAAKRARLVKESRSLIALVKRRIDEVADRFYDMGVALRRLREPEMLDALGIDFEQLCKKHLGLSASLAEKLVHVVSSMTREQAIAMGQSKAIAMAAVAAATPDDDRPAALFAGGELRTPRGKKIDPRKASVREIERVAKEIRQAHAARGARRGRTTTDAERDYAARLEEALRGLGLARVRVTAVATKPGQPSDLRIEHLPIAAARRVIKQASAPPT